MVAGGKVVPKKIEKSPRKVPKKASKKKEQKPRKRKARKKSPSDRPRSPKKKPVRQTSKPEKKPDRQTSKPEKKPDRQTDPKIPMKQREMRQKKTKQNPMKQNPMKQRETRQNETAKSCYSIISRNIGSSRMVAGCQYWRIKRLYVFCDPTNVELSARLPTSIHPQVSTTVLPQWMSTPSKPETFSRRGNNPPPQAL